MEPLRTQTTDLSEGNFIKLKEILKQVVILWCAGFIEACCVHRLLFFCRRSRKLFKRTRQCFLLNGGIFLGSIFLLKYMITPILQWILPVQLPHQEKSDSQDCQIMEAGIRFYSLLQSILISLFYVFWFYPMYVFSFIISTLWYNDIAEQACKVMEQSEQDPQIHNPDKGSGANRQFVPDSGDNLDGLEGMMTVIAEKIYSCLMLSIFFIEVSAISYIPYVGKILNVLLLSWIYAYYSFEYKWNFIGWSLEKRINFFETNWAFFAGFGSPCVLPIVFSSQLVSSGIMAILFPLCVLAATAAHPQEVIDSYSRRWTVHRLSQVPVFYVPNATSLRLLQLLTFFQSRGTRNEKSD